jgi:hypothetical protein
MNNPAYRILGIADNVNACSCCGRNNLQKTVAIENCETGEVGYFGTSCAMQPAKCFGISKDEMKIALAVFKSRKQAVWARTRALYKAAGGRMVSYDDRATGGTLGLRYGDENLRAECEKQARETLKN